MRLGCFTSTESVRPLRTTKLPTNFSGTFFRIKHKLLTNFSLERSERLTGIPDISKILFDAKELGSKSLSKLGILLPAWLPPLITLKAGTGIMSSLVADSSWICLLRRNPFCSGTSPANTEGDSKDGIGT
ncbi:hypothetical protein GW17_00047390 [Ensete ventricosum]|nr:hypothetical protein GW17_00047390 [Ensete ventricosum]